MVVFEKDMKKNDAITELLTRGVDEIIVHKHLEKKLRSGEKLRIKFGIDPTGNLLHLGHAVVLQKLREFQKQGHTIILLIGDHTAEIGDPSGRSKDRVPLNKEQIKKNMATYQEQAGSVLDMHNVEVRYNSEWYDQLNVREFLELTSHVTVPQVLHRADFKKRLAQGEDISVRESFYPILQGYDSVRLHADVEVGGTDQKFNLLMGRQIQKRYGQEEQDIITIPLLEGLDGVHKMSKSANNYIALTEAAETMYGKIMSLPDSLIVRYFELCTALAMNEITAIQKTLKKEGINPRDAKMRLAREIVALYHGEKKAVEAEDAFVATFQTKQVPQSIPTLTVSRSHVPLVDLLIEAKFASSKTEARKLIQQRSVSINTVVIDDCAHTVILPKEGIVLKKGKRHFVKVLANIL